MQNEVFNGHRSVSMFVTNFPSSHKSPERLTNVESQPRATPDCYYPTPKRLMNFVAGRKENTIESYNMNKLLTAIIEREDDGFVALCPEVDVVSQGNTVAEARNNLKEALELFFETASVKEIESRLHKEVYITQVEVAVG